MTLDQPFPPGSILGCYLRDSGGRSQVLSVPQQEAEIRAWCQARGYILLDELIFRDVAKSSKNGTVGRKAFQAMMAYYSNKPAAAGLLLWDFKRWGRDLASSLYWFLDVHQRGVPVYIVSEPIPEGPMGLIFVILKLIGADEENKGRAKDVRRGQHYMINRYDSHQGRYRIGYRGVKVPTGEVRDGLERLATRMEIDPDTGPLIAQAFELRAQGRTLLEVRQATGLPVTEATLSRVLSNRAYLGVWTWGDLERVNIIPPLTDEATFDKCQEVAERNGGNYGPRRVRSSMLLSGVLTCGYCGFKMDANTMTKNGRSYHYYRCPRAFKADKFPCKPIKHYRAAEVEGRVMARLRQVVTTPAILTELHQRARADQAPDTSRKRTSQDAERLAQVRREIRHITDAVKAGMYTSALAREQKALEDEEFELERRVRAQAVRGARNPIPETLDPEQAAEFGREFWAAVEAADARKQQLILRSLVENVTIVRDDTGLLAGSLTLRELPGLGDLSGLTIPL